MGTAARPFIFAWHFLTTIPLSRTHHEPTAPELAASMAWYPVIGLLIGGGLIVADFGLTAILSPAVVNALLIVLLVLLAVEGYSAKNYYVEMWSESQQGISGWYFAASSLIPEEAEGKKVFNCQWDAGSYIFYLRPKMRFVDLLDPSLLWYASPEKYTVRQGLISGAYRDPHLVLREVFGADYVLCGSPELNRQMVADKQHFVPIEGTEPMGPLRVFAVRPD